MFSEKNLSIGPVTKENDIFRRKNVRTGQEMQIFMSGSAGLSGAIKLYYNNEEKFEGMFPRFFEERIEALTHASSLGQISLAKTPHNIYICEIKTGGVFGALWDLCEAKGCGCEVILKDIPIIQEVVEITEVTEDDPYEIESEGCFIIFSDDINESVFDEDGGFAVGECFKLIGRTTRSKDRVLITKTGKRFLTPPERQQKDISFRKADKKQAFPADQK